MVQNSDAERSAAPEREKELREGEYQAYQLRLLNEYLRELFFLEDRREIAEQFLLMCMGAVGTDKGLLLVFDEQEESALHYRGFKESRVQRLREDAFLQAQKHFARDDRDNELLPKQILVISTNEQEAARDSRLPWPADSCFIVRWNLDSGCYGYLVLGPKLDGSVYFDLDRDFLLQLSQVLMDSLQMVRSRDEIHRLNADLMRKNQELSRTIEELKKSHETISILQRTRDRLHGLIHREAARLERVSAWDFVFIIAVTLTISLLYNTTSPGGVSLTPATWSLPEPEMIDTDSAAEIYEQDGAVFVDARPNEFFEQEKIRDAVNLPSNLFDFIYMMHFAQLDPEKKIIVYGRNISRRYDEIVAFELEERGHERVLVMPGGLGEWKAEGMPVKP